MKDEFPHKSMNPTPADPWCVKSSQSCNFISRISFVIHHSIHAGLLLYMLQHVIPGGKFLTQRVVSVPESRDGRKSAFHWPGVLNDVHMHAVEQTNRTYLLFGLMVILHCLYCGHNSHH